MLLTETRKFDIQTYVVDPSAEAPCQFGATKFFQGSLNDYQTVMDLGNQVDVLTIEIENVNLEALEALENEGKKEYQSPKTCRLISNKGNRKDFLIKINIQTPLNNRLLLLKHLK